MSTPLSDAVGTAGGLNLGSPIVRVPRRMPILGLMTGSISTE